MIGWQRPGVWARWRLAGQFERGWLMRLHATGDVAVDQAGAPVLLHRETGEYCTPASHAAAHHGWDRAHTDVEIDGAELEPIEFDDDRAAPTLGQRATRFAVMGLAVATAVSLLVALAVPAVRGSVLGTVLLLAVLGTVGVVAVAASRRWHGLRWARRTVHRQARNRAARASRARRAIRKTDNRDRHIAWVAQRDAEAAERREERRRKNQTAWWQRQGRDR